MLFTQKKLTDLTDTLEGILIGAPKRGSLDARILIYHPEQKSVPVVDITLVEKLRGAKVIIQSPLGIVELADVEDVRFSKTTREAAFFGKVTGGRQTFITVSSYGVIQVYGSVKPSLGNKDIKDLSDDDLRAAVAMKIFGKRASSR